jgi:hypothetical protein
MKQRDWLITAGGTTLLFVIFGFPAVLVPVSMENVPERSRVKVLTVWQDASDTVSQRFRDQANPDQVDGRVAPLPRDTQHWIYLLNPSGRKAPGGGPAILPTADASTGTIGLVGDQHRVTLTLPAYRGLVGATLVLPEAEFRHASDPGQSAR